MPELVVKISGDNTGFAAAAQGAVGIAQRTQAKIGSISSRIGSAFGAGLTPGGIAASIGSAISVGTITRAFNSLSEFTDGILRNSDATGTSTDFWQKWMFAAGQSNVKAKNAEKGIHELTEKLGANVEAFQAWGVATQDANGNALGTEAVLMNIADRMAAIEDPAQRAAMAVALLGAAGMKLIPALKGGSQELRALMDQANVATQGQLEGVDKLGDSWDQLKTAIVTDGGKVTGTFVQIGDAIGRALGFTDRFGVALKKEFMGGISNHLLSGLPSLVDAINQVVPLGSEQESASPATGGSAGISFSGLSASAKASIADGDKLRSLFEDIARINQQIARLHMTDAEVLADMTAELEQQKQFRADAAEDGVQGVELAQLDKEIAQTTLDIESRRGKDGKTTGRPFGIKTDAATSIGGFIGGMQPGIVNDTLGQKQLATQQKIERNTAQLVQKLNSQPQGDYSGFE